MKIIQVTDSHLSQDPEKKLFGLINAEENFLKVLALIKQENPDLVLATGDLSDDGSSASYQRLNKYFTQLNCQVYVLYGNHDNPKNFDRWLVGNNVKKENLLTTKIGSFIFLNSYKEGSNSGYINEENLEHLITNLKQFDNCIPVIHHHFIPLNSMIDNSILENYQQLLEILKRYKSKIKFCITGHVHNFYQQILEGIVVYSGLSTCVQFTLAKELSFASKPPGIIIYTFDKNSYKVAEKTI